jgi:hypothetical protein
MSSRPLFRHPGPAAARLTVDVPDEPEPVQEIDVVRWLAQMQADVAESLGGIMLRAARPVALTVLPTIASASPGRLVGWSVRETTGANPYVLRFHNGDNASADLIAMITGGGGTADNKWFGPGGLSFTEGLYVEVITGAGLSQAIEGVLYVGSAD